MTLTKSQVKRWITKWQRTLKLQDWDIVVTIEPREDLDGADGDCGHTLGRKHGIIRLARYRKSEVECTFYDPEQTLVHELLHLHFAPFESKRNGSPEDISQEQAIDTMAKVVVAQSREIDAMKAEIKTQKGRKRS